MNIEIKKLSADLLDDWLCFFDNTAFSDNDDWAGCYCMCCHWNDELASKRAWDCSKSNAAHNRKCAVNFIKNGIMQGYLAYYDGKAAGWCNVNDKQAYDSVNLDFNWEDSEKGKRIKSIVCFCIAPDLRGRGIASQLFEKVAQTLPMTDMNILRHIHSITARKMIFTVQNQCTKKAASRITAKTMVILLCVNTCSLIYK
ncbi:MAG: GNAT family N-acetyltransferase [Oscillospiraceae bacterium]|nr:GNAT family N-acetyltransferase [Oscillospiraceae bacterium]